MHFDPSNSFRFLKSLYRLCDVDVLELDSEDLGMTLSSTLLLDMRPWTRHYLFYANILIFEKRIMLASTTNKVTVSTQTMTFILSFPLPFPFLLSSFLPSLCIFLSILTFPFLELKGKIGGGSCQEGHTCGKVAQYKVIGPEWDQEILLVGVGSGVQGVWTWESEEGIHEQWGGAVLTTGYWLPRKRLIK